MALKIRLSRGGSKKRPFYRVVVADSRAPRDGRYIEKIGTYNPRTPANEPGRVNIDGERAAVWIKHGAVPTDRVARFLSQITLEGESKPVYEWTHGNNPQKGEPGTKAKERLQERADKEAARKEAEEEAKKQAEEEKAAAAEAPAEEEAPAEAAAEGEAAAEAADESEAAEEETTS